MAPIVIRLLPLNPHSSPVSSRDHNMGEIEDPVLESLLGDHDHSDDAYRWQTVTNPKRHRKSAKTPAADPDRDRIGGLAGDSSTDKSNVFRSVEQKAEERRRRAAEARRAAAAAQEVDFAKSLLVLASDEDSDGEDAVPAGNVEGDAEVKKPKQKKPKKPKITIADAASKIEAADLVAYLADVTVDSYEGQQNIQLMRFADYFARAFSGVGAAQFPWTKLFKESPVDKIVDVPLCYVSEDVYKTSVDWISQRSVDALGSFVLWALDSILMGLPNHSGTNKGSKKPTQQSSSKAQVDIFVVLAMILRRKPDVLINQLSTLRDNSSHKLQDNLPVIVWMIAQASLGDLVVGMYAWMHILLPVICGKSNCNPHSRDLILQLVERLVSAPKSRPILLNGAVRKGERLVPPLAVELLMRAAFPAQSARIKATERFEAVYPILKEVALTGSPGSKALKQVSQQLFIIALKAMSEDNTALSKEAAGIFIWCLTQNADCYMHWVDHYMENIEASVIALRTISDEWNQHAANLTPYDMLRQTLKYIKQENEQALAGDVDANRRAYIKEIDKSCKFLLKKITLGFSCMKSGLFVLTVAVAAGAFVVSPKMESLDLNKLYLMFLSAWSV